MHVAFSLLTLDPGQVGGSETYARGLLAAFARGKGPERVTVLAGPRAAPGLLDVAGGPVTIETVAGLDLGAGRGGRALALARGMVRAPAVSRELASAADVLHLPLTVPIPRAGTVASVLTLFDLLHHDVPELFGQAERAFRRIAYDRAAQHATRVVTVSAHSRERIIDRLGIAPGAVTAIHPGVDHARFHPGPVWSDPSALASCALPEPPWLLYPAALWPHKNHATLLEALAGCPEDLSLVLTGAAFGREEPLREAAARLGVGDRVHHLGWVRGEAMPALCRAATGMVFPSLAEGFGQPPIEAMACGCPVAASDTGAVAEACGGAALAFAPGDPPGMARAMTRLVCDDQLRGELREAGVARARAFTWERSAERHAEIYEAARSAATRP